MIAAPARKTKHTPLRSGLLCAVILSTFHAVSPAHAQLELLDKALDKATGTRVEVHSVFNPPPALGYAPLRIVGTNGGTQDANWDFTFRNVSNNYRSEHSHTSHFALPVAGRSTQSALFLCPMMVDYGSSGYSNNTRIDIAIANTGYGRITETAHNQRMEKGPEIAIGAEFSIDALNKEVRKRTSSSSRSGGRSIFGSQFEPSELPDSWLGFTGFDYVMISGTEWQKLRPTVQRALVDWVRLGGQLHVYLSSGVQASSLGLSDVRTMGRSALGLGAVSLFEWNGVSLPASETVARYVAQPGRADSLTSEHATSNNWPLLASLGERSFASWQVILFLIVFGILIGPVNLYMLAPSGKRHRLFVTTPLLSLGASLLMGGLILWQDGTGGEGRRFAAIQLAPTDAAAYIAQEQVCRTGVLFSTGFEVSQPALIEPLALPDTPWVKLKNNHKGQSAQLTQSGLQRSGNYFQSRAEQGQVLRAAVSTRARLELKKGAAEDSAPILVSALGFTVEDVFYADAKGGVWMLKEPLATGQSATLVKSDAAAQRTLWEKATQPAAASLRYDLRVAALNQRSFFTARAKAAPGFILDTLPSIRWQDDQILVFGPVAQP